MSSDRSRELRDARAAIERLALAHSAAATEMRPALIAATTDDEPTTRGNAIFFLQQLGPDEETADWLRPRLRDENDVVRRWAAQAAETLELDELRDDVAAAYDAEADELAAEALAIALFALTSETDRLSALRELMANRVGWGPRRPPRREDRSQRRAESPRGGRNRKLSGMGAIAQPPVRHTWSRRHSA
jgi:hypothetical protein